MEQQKGSTSKEMIWALRWSVALRTFYRQILSLLYSSFPFGNFRPRLVRALLVHILYSLELTASSPLKIGPNCPKNGNRSSSNLGFFWGCRVSAVGLREGVPLKVYRTPFFLKSYLIPQQKILPETNSKFTPENRPKLPQKRKSIIFQSLVFRDELLVSGRVPCFPSKRHRKWAFLTPRNMISDLHEKW